MRKKTRLVAGMAGLVPVLAGAHPGHEPLIHEFVHDSANPPGISSGLFVTAILLGCATLAGVRWYTARVRERRNARSGTNRG